MFEGFDNRRIAVHGVEINAVVGGSGPPLLLLHGYPQTHVMWHKVAPRLAQSFTVVAPDLRGYGDSGKPASTPGHEQQSKRAMAADQVAVMEALGHGTFLLAGHDRGGRVAYRLALDHPDRVRRLATLDIVPTWEQFKRVGDLAGLNVFHWYFLAQPAPFPERLIGADPDYFLDYLFDFWNETEGALTDEAMAEYRRCFRDPEVIRATCEDYRAGASVDYRLDEADAQAGRKIGCPVLALWGAKGRPHKRQGVMEVWTRWATDLRGDGIDCGHFLAEEAPDETAAALLAFFGA